MKDNIAQMIEIIVSDFECRASTYTLVSEWGSDNYYSNLLGKEVKIRYSYYNNKPYLYVQSIPFGLDSDHMQRIKKTIRNLEELAEERDSAKLLEDQESIANDFTLHNKPYENITE